jgi:uncharacterized membrane protein
MLIKKFTNIQPQKFFVIIALFFGIFYAYFTPLFQGPDEPSHFLSISRLSNGYLRANFENGSFGTRADQGSLELFNFVPNLAGQSKYNYADQIERLLKINPDNESSAFITTVGAAYSPASYLPYIITFKIMSIARVNPFMIFILLRLVGLFIWVWLTYLAIKIIPKGKWIMTTLALLPMTLFISSVISADTLTNGFLFLVVSMVFFGISKPKEVSKKYLLALFGAVILLGISKQTFFIVSLLIFAVPKPDYISKKMYYAAIILTIVSCAALSICWQVFIGNWSVSPIPGVSPGAQMKFLVSRPLSAVKVLWNTFLPTGSNSIYISFIGVLGLIDVSLPIWITFGWVIALFKSLGTVKKNAVSILNRWQKGIFISISILLASAMLLGLYLTWTPVGGGSIQGIQGRYLIPVFAILIPVFVSRKNEPSLLTRRYLMAGVLLLEIATAVVFAARYIQIL